MLAVESAADLHRIRFKRVNGHAATRTRTLEARWIDPHLEQNSKEHHTHQFNALRTEHDPFGRLVVRRAQPFRLEIAFSHPIDVEKDKMELVWTLERPGLRPVTSNGTKVTLGVPVQVDEALIGSGWKVETVQLQADRVTVDVTAAAQCPVGVWNMLVRCTDAEANASESPLNAVYILFNAWSADDPVYMAHHEYTGEYVLAETGVIYRGDVHHARPTPWNFAQYECGMLQACMHLLDETHLSVADRASAVHIAPALCELVGQTKFEKDIG